MAKDLLLVSNTKVAGGKHFAHARQEINDLFGDRKTITFIPYARPGGMDHEAYCAALQPTFKEMGYNFELIDPDEPARSLERSEAIFVGGGNTWHLLKNLRSRSLLQVIRRVVSSGTPYMGSSAGSNVAGMSIGNTNDMPAAEIGFGFSALSLVPFNINPHYQDPVTLSPKEREAVLKVAPQLRSLIDHQGETREDRLREYHALGNIEKVVALREGSFLRVSDRHGVWLGGESGARIFKPEEKPVDVGPIGALDDFL